MVVKQRFDLGFTAGKDWMAACEREVAVCTDMTANMVVAGQI